MKKLLLLILVLVILGGLAFVLSQGMVPGLQSERQVIIQQTKRFWECIQFKEFEEAANFHNREDRDKANIPDLIEKLFKIPPEQLDIQDFTIMFGEIDSTGALARVKTKCFTRVLNTDEKRIKEVILYWKKEKDQWFLKLRSSLERFRK